MTGGKILIVPAVLIGMMLSGCGSSRKVQSSGGIPPVSATPSGITVATPTVKTEKKCVWGDINYDGRPWTENVSRPVKITQGLYNRHISLWASHGRYYDIKRDTWKWQRPLLFGTCEDLFTRTIVVPYLIPMLENAGAVVFTPRERDPQKNEVIVDNDDNPQQPYYTEININRTWQDAGIRGFARHGGVYHDGENPFESGTTRMIRAEKGGLSEVSYQPRIPEEGEYAVYVSYPDVGSNVDDAHYTVYHQGQRTDIRVNQRMGAGTWTYIGTFRFSKGCSSYNRVVITNDSEGKGYVTTDAVRFGGGMGNIERGGFVSGLPRCLEGARYYAQWAGAPYGIYSTKDGKDDYGDDINVRSLMTNWLGGGSCYMPDRQGRGVPVELSLAIHSDAGYARDGRSLIGSLSICTTDVGDGLLSAGISRQNSKDLATRLLDNMQKDVAAVYGRWNTREVLDRNYSETRLPAVPAAILETMSHQNFPDMIMGQDPNVRFTVARSIYKTVLKYIADAHGEPYTVAPLSPLNFRIEFTGIGEVTLRWDAQTDPQEPTARPAAYVLYISVGNGDFDNGTRLTSTSCKINLKDGLRYNFRVTAANDGGESFPTETLSAIYNEGAERTVLIINGFNRLSAPAVMNTSSGQGFDFDADPGVSYGSTMGWSGRQHCFDVSKAGIEGSGGLGYSGTEWQGMNIAGNDFNYVCTHAEALLPLKRYNVVSCSRGAVETGRQNVMRYDCIDLLLGLEKYDAHAMVYYKTFTPAMQDILEDYTRHGGALFVSGSYIASDMTSQDDRRFLADILKTKYEGSERNDKNGTINGMGTTFDIYRQLNERHYAAVAPDVIMPVAPAWSALTYSSGHSACVAYDGSDYRLFVLGFPFECITDPGKRAQIMRGAMNFLCK